MAFFSSDDSEVRKRMEHLEKAVRQKDSLYQTLENVHLKLEADFKEVKENYKLSQYNLSLETRKAAEAEAALEKTRLDTKDFPTQRYNFESTIRSHESTIQSKDKIIKQLERDLDREAASSGDGQSRLTTERDALREINKRLDGECKALKASQGSATVDNEDVKKLHVQLSALQSENDELRTASNASDSSGKRRRRSSSFSGLYERHAAADDREVQQLRSKLARSERELLQASNGLAALQRSSGQELHSLKSQLEDAQDDLKEAQGQLHTAEDALKRTSEERDRHSESLRQQVDTLNQLTKAQHDEIETLSKDHQALKRKHEELVAQHEQVSTALGTAQSELEQGSSSKRQLDAQLGATQEKLQEAEMLFEVSREAAEVLKQERDHLIKQLSHKDVGLQELQQQCQQLTRLEEDARHSEQRCRVMEEELETLHQEKDSLSSALQVAQQQAKHKSGLAERLEAEASELRTHLEESAQGQMDWQKEQTRAQEERHRLHQAETAALEQRAKALEEKEDLEARHAELLLQHQNLQERRSFDDINVFQLQEDLDTCSIKVETLEQALKQAEQLEESSSSERAILVRRIAHLDQEVSDLKEAQEDAETSRQGRGFAAEVERSEAQAALEGATCKVGQLEELVEARQQYINTLEADLAQVQQDRQDSIAELQLARDRIHELQDQLATAQKEQHNQLRTLRQQTQDLAVELESSQQRAIGLQHDCDTTEQLRVQLAADVISIQSQYKSEQELTAQLREELHLIQETLAEADQREDTVAPTSTATPQKQREGSPDTPQRNLNAASVMVQRLRSERDLARADHEFAQAEQGVLVNQLKQRIEHLTCKNVELDQKLQEGLSPSNELLQNDAQTAPSAEEWEMLRNKQCELEARVLRRNEQIGLLQTELKQTQSNLAMAQDSLEGMEKLLEQANEELHRAQSAQSESHNTDTQRPHLEQTKPPEQDQYNEPDQSSQLQKMQDQLGAAKCALESAREEASARTTQIEQLNETLKQLQERLSTSEGASQKAHITIEGLQEKVCRLEGELAVAGHRVFELEGQYRQLEESKSVLIEQHSQELDQRLSSTADLQTAKAQLEAQLREQQKSASRLEEEHRALQTQLEALENSLQHQQRTSDAVRSGLQQTVEATEQTSASLRNRLEANEESLKASQTESERLRKDADRLKHEVKTLRGLVSQKDEAVTRLEGVLEETRSEAENLVSDFNMCSSELERWQIDCEGLQRTREDLAKQLDESEREQSRLQERLASQESEQMRLVQEIDTLRSEPNDEAAQRIQELEEQLQQQSEDMEETDDRYLTALKDIKRLQESYERLQVRCETLQREVRVLEEFRTNALQKQLSSAASSSVKSEAPTPIRAQAPPATRTSSSSSKKRSMPEDFENATAPVRAIAVSNSPTKGAASAPATAVNQRLIASFKPKTASVAADGRSSKGALESRLGKRPAPLGSARQPLKDEGANPRLGGHSSRGSQSDKLRASLAALQQQPRSAM